MTLYETAHAFVCCGLLDGKMICKTNLPVHTCQSTWSFLESKAGRASYLPNGRMVPSFYTLFPFNLLLCETSGCIVLR